MKSRLLSVMKYLKDNHHVSDKEFHKWCKNKGYNVDQTESMAYSLASKYSRFALGGKSKGKMPKGVNPKEVAEGTKVEMEHTDNKEDARKITADHLAEVKDISKSKKPVGYYPPLAKMEDSIKEKVAKVLSSMERKNLSAGTFAVPASMARKEEPNQPARKGEKGKYPMPDKRHAISAVAYVKRFGTPAEKQKVFDMASSRFGVGPGVVKNKKACIALKQKVASIMYFQAYELMKKADHIEKTAKRNPFNENIQQVNNNPVQVTGVQNPVSLNDYDSKLKRKARTKINLGGKTLETAANKGTIRHTQIAKPPVGVGDLPSVAKISIKDNR